MPLGAGLREPTTARPLRSEDLFFVAVGTIYPAIGALLVAGFVVAIAETPTQFLDHRHLGTELHGLVDELGDER